MNFSKGKELLTLCESEQIRISEAMIRREVQYFEGTREEILARMAHSWKIMKESVEEGQQEGNRSMGGLIGGEGHKVSARRDKGNSLVGPVISKAMAYAMGVLEVNASMGLIVAAPTAGSSGVIPGVFCALQEEFGFSDEQMIEALFTTGAIGYLITRNATVAGAEGGCQAEIGAAAAMAAGAAVELFGGSPAQVLSAASSVLGTMLGLVCDPIGGLVEAPCQKRNAVGASNALVCAEMTLAGVDNLIPFDEMVDVMYKVGRSLPYELRETALGGIAASPTACQLCSLSGECTRL
ncbi:MAG: L-serine ammonia-lyase, iron-sulfur-dependent, subunit alpha [Firmicutes bacterium]|nr:L-serine ammonia-lyase, iron-sulfur-dependent, subunit alpha [Bacillota bacterium]